MSPDQSKNVLKEWDSGDTKFGFLSSQQWCWAVRSSELSAFFYNTVFAHIYFLFLWRLFLKLETQALTAECRCYEGAVIKLGTFSLMYGVTYTQWSSIYLTVSERELQVTLKTCISSLHLRVPILGSPLQTSRFMAVIEPFLVFTTACTQTAGGQDM